MWRGVPKSVSRVSNTSPDHCRYSIGYLLARSILYETLTVLAAAYPSDVILVSHILSIPLCAVRAHRRVLPIRRSVRTMPWSTPTDVGRAAMCVACKCFCLLYSFNTILSLPTDVSVLVVPPHLSPFADRSVRWRDACGRTDCRGHDHGRLLCESVA